MRKIAIIGSGMAGLTLAHRLKQHAEVLVFDKASQAGGRMASRSAGAFHFDHGAQFFTVKSQRFADFIQPLIEQGVIQRWDARFVEFAGAEILNRRQWNADYPHYVGSPAMQSVGQSLAKPLTIRFDCHITRLERQADKWRLLSSETCVAEHVDWVICCLPARQAADLLPENFPHVDVIRQTKMLPCYALMLGFEQSPEIDWQAALVSKSIISWMSINSSKPCRPEAVSMVIQANNLWAEKNLHAPTENITQHMLAEVRQISGIDTTKASHVELKRWVYANMSTQHTQSVYLDNHLQLAACGDWCRQGRVEAAFLSADSLAQQLIPYLSPSR